MVRNEWLLVIVRDRGPNEFLVLADDFIRSCFSYFRRGRHSVRPFPMHTLPPFSIGCICSRLRLRAGNLAIRLRPAISEELPSGAYLRDFIQVNIVREQLVLVAAFLRNNFAPRIAEKAFSVEFPDVP